MKKLVYFLGYFGGIGSLLMSILISFIYYTHYSIQFNPNPYILSRVIVSVILIILSLIIIIFLLRMDFSKVSSCIILIVIAIIGLLLPGIMDIIAKYNFFINYEGIALGKILIDIVHNMIDYFPLVLVIISGILFLLIERIEKEK